MITFSETSSSGRKLGHPCLSDSSLNSSNVLPLGATKRGKPQTESYQTVSFSGSRREKRSTPGDAR